MRGFGNGDEVDKRDAFGAVASDSAAAPDAEALHAVFFDGEKAKILNAGETFIFGCVVHADFDFARQVKCGFEGENVFFQFFRIGEYVERGIFADSAEGGCQEIAEGVTASAAERQTEFLTEIHDGFDPVRVDVVELDILTRGEVEIGGF